MDQEIKQLELEVSNTADANLKYRSDNRIRLSANESLVDAVSPRINVSTITGGHRLNNVDIDDTVDILDGAKGDKGDKGDPGPQGPKGDNVEVGLKKAKVDIVNAVRDISSKYSLPASWILMILENIVSESKPNTFQNVIVQYDISNLVANDRPVIPTPELVSDRLPTQAPVKMDKEKTDGRDKNQLKFMQWRC